jgi:hypothetical protein
VYQVGQEIKRNHKGSKIKNQNNSSFELAKVIKSAKICAGPRVICVRNCFGSIRHIHCCLAFVFQKYQCQKKFLGSFFSNDFYIP